MQLHDYNSNPFYTAKGVTMTISRRELMRSAAGRGDHA
jgi:hypothetical protein